MRLSSRRLIQAACRVGACSLLCLAACRAFAVEYEAGLGVTRWRYQERSGRVSGIAATPLSSSASGEGLSTHLTARLRPDERSSLAFSLHGVVPFTDTRESWVHAQGTQVNELQVFRTEQRAEFARNLKAVTVGGWLSHDYFQQRRRNFYVNGFQFLTDFGDVRETVQTVWGGVLTQVDMKAANMKGSARLGAPIWLKTTNSAIPGVIWRDTSGLLVQISLETLEPLYVRQLPIRFSVAYDDRRLDGGLQGGALWPSNRFRQITAGVKLDW